MSETLDLCKINKGQLREAYKIVKRIQKYGDANVVHKRGRKPVSPEHKKEVFKAWYNKKKEEENAKKKALGIIQTRGRPKKTAIIQDENKQEQKVEVRPKGIEVLKVKKLRGRPRKPIIIVVEEE
jgi:phage terminase Nu1 subunit (DNA packaging protein)